MKLLMIYCDRFSYNPNSKTLDGFPEVTEKGSFENALVAFIQAEAEDEADMKSTETKMVKNLKWAAKKNNTKNVVLHSFAHLSESKADPFFTKELFDKVESRMNSVDYQCDQTPFGYFLDILVEAPGTSEARIFKSF
ncbi:MAG: threonyl-tRNA synthetase editing domain-containing protein [Bacteroidales bacterium]|nr:threonyl-tRNA synthetase editing domain-containing protein [Bacteroidales bacterium]